MYRVIFLTGPPNFSTKKKIVNQPITVAVPENLVNKKGCDWLIGDFLFGTEIRGRQLKKSPCILSLFTLSLTGPSGSGKTAAVFALAAELSFNVLEVNASSGRNGKHEARSHPEPAGEEGAGEGEGGGGQ